MKGTQHHYLRSRQLLRSKQEQAMYDRHWVLWDGKCGFCRRAAHWIQAQDTSGSLRVVPYQDAPEPPMNEQLRVACDKAVHVVQKDGTVLSGAAACLFLLKEVGYPVPTRFLQQPPMRQLLEGGYQLVARNRLLASRFLFRKS